MIKHLHQIIPLLFASLFVIGLMGIEAEKIINTEREIAIVRKILSGDDLKSAQADTFIERRTPLFSGDTLRTDKNGYAMIQFMDRSVVAVRPLSELIVNGEVNRDQTTITRIDLNRGGVFVILNRSDKNEIEITTSSTIASVKGTTFGAQSSGYYWVEEGNVEVMALQSGQTVSVLAGMFAQIEETGSDIITGHLSANELEQLGRGYWSLDDDQVQKWLILQYRDSDGKIINRNVEFFEDNNQ